MPALQKVRKKTFRQTLKRWADSPRASAGKLSKSKLAYYNEIDPYAAQWLRNLIDAGEIAPGDVDERSIEDVKPDELMGYTQCHFFAGLGGWSYALRLAGWADERPVWTGSCPCQPFSAAGKRAGVADERHLWPAWFHLIEICRPVNIFGEQVASKDGLAWLDDVSSDLEGAGYAAGAVDLAAFGVGAPCLRNRLWIVAERGVGLADATKQGLQGASRRERERSAQIKQPERLRPTGHGAAVANADNAQRRQGAIGRGDDNTEETRRDKSASGNGECSSPRSVALGDTDRENGRTNSGEPLPEPDGRRLDRGTGAHGAGVTQGNASDEGLQGRLSGRENPQRQAELRHTRRPGPTNGWWADAEYVYCKDGYVRAVEPRSFPLGYGLPNRVGRIRAYGNAIVPQAAAAVIGAYLETSN